MLRSFAEALAKESAGNCERRRQHEAVEDGSSSKNSKGSMVKAPYPPKLSSVKGLSPSRDKV